jgi:pimeloyl-ACP methyl ester carboxylesterase
MIAFNRAMPEDIPTPMQVLDQFAGIGSGVADNTIYDHLGNITNPVLIILGSQDLLVDYHSSYILEQSIPKATMLQLDNAGHGAIFQYAHRVSPVIIEVLDD